VKGLDFTFSILSSSRKREKGEVCNKKCPFDGPVHFHFIQFHLSTSASLQGTQVPPKGTQSTQDLYIQSLQQWDKGPFSSSIIIIFTLSQHILY
jgi:hypothetical protein